MPDTERAEITERDREMARRLAFSSHSQAYIAEALAQARAEGYAAATQRILELEEALTGLLALAGKMWGYLEQAKERGVAHFTPESVQFDDLRFVKRSRAALAQKGGA